MAIPMRNNEVQDADAVYILGKIKAADDCETVATSKVSDARQFRIEAGLRLIEVRTKVSQDKEKSGDPNAPGWLAWLRTNNIAESTARSLMKLAGFSEEQREEHKAKEAARKRDERAKVKSERIGWPKVLFNAFGIVVHPGLKPEIEKQMGEEFPSFFNTSVEANAWLQRYIEKVGLPPEVPREQLPKSAEERVQRVIRIETAKVHACYRADVEKGIESALSERIAHVEQLREKVEKKEKRYEILLAGINPIISKNDYRFLLNTLHSDRMPTTDKLDKAFIIVKKLEPYINAI